MRLRRSSIHQPGIVRRRRGRGFSYTTAAGEPVTDDETIERIRTLAVPPAWREVWICPRADGHIQAVGRDDAGRRQYLYHEQWRRERDEEKFDRVLELAGRLPAMRDRLREDLAQRGSSRHRVLAVAIALLDSGVFRVGNEEYTESNGTHGVATLLCEHVRVSGTTIHFDFTAKGGAQRRVRIEDAALARAVRSLLRAAGNTGRLLVPRDGEGCHPVHADDVNDRFRELTGPQFSVKDLRTWQATVLAAADFATRDLPRSARGRQSVIKEVMTDVAQILGNTATVARGSYVDPRIVSAFEDGTTISAALRRAQRLSSTEEQRAVVERAVVRLLRAAERPHGA